MAVVFLFPNSLFLHVYGCANGFMGHIINLKEHGRKSFPKEPGRVEMLHDIIYHVCSRVYDCSKAIEVTAPFTIVYFSSPLQILHRIVSLVGFIIAKFIFKCFIYKIWKFVELVAVGRHLPFSIMVFNFTRITSNARLFIISRLRFPLVHSGSS